MVSHFILTAIF